MNRSDLSWWFSKRKGPGSISAFWRRRGYERRPKLHTTFFWRDLDEAAESPKPMVFWLKRLAAQ